MPAASSKPPRKNGASRSTRAPYTEQQRLEAFGKAEWIAKLMELSDVDSNKKGGVKSFQELKSQVLSLAPESFRDRIQWMPFKGNTRSVHRAACDKIIEEVMKDTEPAVESPAAAPAPAAEAPAEAVREVKRRPNTRSQNACRDTRPKQPGLERFFKSSATALASPTPRPETAPSARRRACEQRAESYQCHYTKLGISDVATLAQIIKAYRQMALKTHPDKGGTDKEFQEVKAAFDILSCAEKRARYDASRFGRDSRRAGEHGEHGEESEEPQPPCVEEVAKSMLVALLMKRLPKETLSHVDLASLLKIHELLQLMRERMKGQPKEGLRNDLSEKSGTGLTRKRNGEYQVDVSWRCFRVRADHIVSLDHATELHCALVGLREGAQARIKKALAMRGRCSDRDANAANEEPPLLEEELLQMKVPWMLQFASDLRSKWQNEHEDVHEDEDEENPKLGKDDRWMTPYTPKLSTAYQFRRQLRQRLGLKKEMASRQHDKTIQSELAKEETKDFLRLQEELFAFASKELQERPANGGTLEQALQTMNHQAIVRNQLICKYERLQDRHCELKHSLSVCEEEKTLLQLANQELATRCKNFKRREQERQRIENSEKRNAAEKKKEKGAAPSGAARHFLKRD